MWIKDLALCICDCADAALGVWIPVACLMSVSVACLIPCMRQWHLQCLCDLDYRTQPIVRNTLAACSMRTVVQLVITAVRLCSTHCSSLPILCCPVCDSSARTAAQPPCACIYSKFAAQPYMSAGTLSQENSLHTNSYLAVAPTPQLSLPHGRRAQPHEASMALKTCTACPTHTLGHADILVQRTLPS